MGEAVGRGAKIDILWGASPDKDSGDVSTEVAKCREALGQDDVLGVTSGCTPFPQGRMRNCCSRTTDVVVWLVVWDRATG